MIIKPYIKQSAPKEGNIIKSDRFISLKKHLRTIRNIIIFLLVTFSLGYLTENYPEECGIVGVVVVLIGLYWYFYQVSNDN